MLIKAMRGLYFAPPADQGSGGAGGSGGDPAAGDPAKIPAPEPGKEGDPAKTDPKKPEPKTVTMTQEDFDKTIEDRLARQRAALQKKQDDDKAALDKKALEEQQKFQELSEKQAKELDSLKAEKEALEKRVEELETGIKARDTALGAQVEALKKDVEPAVLSLLENLSIPQQLEWLVTNKPTGNGKEPSGQKTPIPPSPTKDERKIREIGEEEKKKASEEQARRYRADY